MKLLKKIFPNLNLVLLAIILLAAAFRLNGLNWDSGFHLHPDERFLTMVSGVMKLPSNLQIYFDPHRSLLNPINIGYPFFVYGVFPLIFNKILALILGNDNYAMITIQGRFLSVVFDVISLALIYKTVALLEKKYRFSSLIKYWASFFYAIAVLPIQLSHFFTVDVFLNFFMLASFYFSLNYSFIKKNNHLVFASIFFGLALASKVTAVYILPLNLFFIWLGSKEKRKWSLVINFLIFFLISYLTLRLTDPYVFESNNFFNLSISKSFLLNLKTLKSFEGKDIWYPPGVQWINKPISFALVNLAFFGVGLPYFLLIIFGVYFIIKLRNNHLKAILLWTLLFFFYQSVQFVKVMRYFIFIYPFLAILAGFGIHKLSTITSKKWIKLIVIALVMIWPVAFSSIYFNKHSRVEASEWIYQNLENNRLILAEYWDDALPLTVEERYGKSFPIIYLPVFDQDTPQKWQKMDEFLTKGDYYILSSNRGWGSIPTVPEKYPQMTQFYKNLFEGKLNYKLIRTFTSYPKLCLKFNVSCLTFNDDWADESFTVYDHPKVLIFKKI